MVCSLLMIAYFIISIPYKVKIRNVMEILNELSLLLSLYCYLNFTDYIEELEMKNAMGWLLIYSTVLNLTINFLVILVNVTYSILAIFKKKKILKSLSKAKKY